jgi:hypothetical protein
MKKEDLEFVSVLPLGSPLHITGVNRSTNRRTAALCDFIEYAASAGPIDDRLHADFVCRSCRRLYEAMMQKPAE